MTVPDDLPPMGVEEEYFLTSAGSRAVVDGASAILPGATALLGDRFSGELMECQVEAKTPPCTTLEQVHGHLTAMRAAVTKAAGAQGLRIHASGTPVLGLRDSARLRDDPRYLAAHATFRARTEGAVISATHVHVQVPGREEAVLVGNHLRPWLPALVALSANSPFWAERDTGYASWRIMAAHALPVFGPPPYFASLDHYEQVASRLREAEAVVDEGMLFWDVRPCTHLPTVEIRVMDAVADAEAVAALAALIRATVVTALTRVYRGDPGPVLEEPALSTAYWRAARDGLLGFGVDVRHGRLLRAPELVAQLVRYARPTLAEYGELGPVCRVLRRWCRLGGGAAVQRAAFGRRGHLRDVVDDLTSATAGVLTDFGAADSGACRGGGQETDRVAPAPVAVDDITGETVSG
ncbi:glutamate--cysteine ligase [Streptomyces sp. NPDC058284]|uniref:carboxylate-amine ligase n=1 Tax=unclassified Streptomyces TaxID=2593676 RepID=UPI00364B9F0B